MGRRREETAGFVCSCGAGQAGWVVAEGVTRKRVEVVVKAGSECGMRGLAAFHCGHGYE